MWTLALHCRSKTRSYFGGSASDPRCSVSFLRGAVVLVQRIIRAQKAEGVSQIKEVLFALRPQAMSHHILGHRVDHRSGGGTGPGGDAEPFVASLSLVRGTEGVQCLRPSPFKLYRLPFALRVLGHPILSYIQPLVVEPIHQKAILTVRFRRNAPANGGDQRMWRPRIYQGEIKEDVALEQERSQDNMLTRLIRDSIAPRGTR